MSMQELDIARMLLIKGGQELALLRQRADGTSCMHLAAGAGHMHMVKLLLNFGGRDLVMLRQHNGTSCLFKAAARGHVAVVDLLIDVGGRELIMMENYATVRYGTRLGDLKESCFILFFN